MSDKSSIKWCDATWNPVVGCTKRSYRVGKKRAGNNLDGEMYEVMPE